MNTVTVIIPAYNAEDIVGDCMEALLAQEDFDGNLHIMVVDDASTDNTVQRVEEFESRARDQGVVLRVFRQTRNQGPATARNRGAEAADDGIIIFTDSDCVPDSRWVAEMVAPFASNDVSAVKGAYRTRQKALVARFAQAEFEARYRMLEAAPHVDVVFSYSAAFRKQVFMDVGMFDTGFPVADNEDTDLSYRVASAGYKIIFNPRAIIYHRHPDTLKKYLGKKVSRAYWRVVVYRRFPEKVLKDSYTPQSLKLQILLVFLFASAALISPLSPAGYYGMAASGMLFFATTVPFTLRLSGDDWPLWFASPLLILGRAVAMAIGLIKVVPRLLHKEPA